MCKRVLFKVQLKNREIELEISKRMGLILDVGIIGVRKLEEWKEEVK